MNSKQMLTAVIKCITASNYYTKLWSKTCTSNANAKHREMQVSI